MSDSKNVPGAQAKATVLDEGSVFAGTLSTTSPIIVRGQLEGTVTGPSLEVTETGKLSGQIKVAELKSSGALAGEYDVERIELSGRVSDKTIIRTQSLEIKPAMGPEKMSVVFGECELCVGEAPNKKAAIEQAIPGAKP